ncbi:hypothetical protein O0L34_g10354 [Tuta absoluta]|nr:hypothetical protein O0L34_g10354 [Tuta absoluta]
MAVYNLQVLMNQWLDTAYMSPVNRGHIQTQMERESEVCLNGFLKTDKREELLTALRSSEVEWEPVGPANRRHYSRVKPSWTESLPREHAIKAILSLLSSGQFVRMLHDCTDLSLRHYSNLEMQCWRPGDFTLLPPRSMYAEPRLEAVLYVGVPHRTLSGGNTTYLAPEDAGGGAGGEALVTVPPCDNALSLVYCDAGCAGFTKYLSKMTLRAGECFYVLTCTYKE